MAQRVPWSGISNFQGENAVALRDLATTVQRMKTELQELGRFLGPSTRIIYVSLTAAQILEFFDSTGLGKRDSGYFGWAIRNGNNGTDNDNGKFHRCNTGGAGATGGNDSSAHVHAINHNHASFDSGSEATHSHGPGTYYAAIYMHTDNYIYEQVIDSALWEVNKFGVLVTQGPTSGWSLSKAAAVGGASGTGSVHNHAVDPPSYAGSSGAATTSDNRPAYREVVPLQWVGGVVPSFSL